MQTVTKEVKTKGKVVATVDITIYENIDELMENVEEKVIVERFNHANTIAIMGNERQKHTPTKMGKTKKMRMAFNLLTPEEAMSCAGDYDKLQELLESKIPEVEATLATEAAA